MASCEEETSTTWIKDLKRLYGVNATLNKKTIILTGTVGSYYNKQVVQEIAKQQEAGFQVNNCVRVANN
jgi:osmotically-inducible protein OsmY